MTSTAPAASNLLARGRRGSRRAGAAPARSAITPTGTLTKKIHSQLSASVRTPPSSTPAAAPKPPTAPQTPSAMLRSRPSAKVVDRIDSAAGEMIAAPSPCRARAPISDCSDQASPASSEASGEDDHAHEEDATSSQQVGGAAAEEQQAAEDQRVGADHPLQVLLGEPEVDLDRRQRDVHDRDVQDDHELDHAQQRQRQPLSSFRGHHLVVSLHFCSVVVTCKVAVTTFDYASNFFQTASDALHCGHGEALRPVLSDRSRARPRRASGGRCSSSAS